MGLRKSINLKNKSCKKLIRTRNQCIYAKYKVYRNKLNNLISKKKYYEEYFTYNKSNIKNIWKGKKQIVTLKPKVYATPTKIITSSNKVLPNANGIANEFNTILQMLAKL